MTLKDMVVEVAPGVKYNTWAFDGHGAPARRPRPRGQTVEMTLTNGGRSHSIDFRRADRAERRLQRRRPRRVLHVPLQGGRPRRLHVPLRTKPVLAHIANGMYGAIVVDPGEAAPTDEYVLVASEWYLDSDGIQQPASLSVDKARAMAPDWTTFNGYANQYVTHPLTAKPGETTRFYVVAAGPTLERHSTSSARSSTGPG